MSKTHETWSDAAEEAHKCLVSQGWTWGFNPGVLPTVAQVRIMLDDLRRAMPGETCESGGLLVRCDKDGGGYDVFVQVGSIRA